MRNPTLSKFLILILNSAPAVLFSCGDPIVNEPSKATCLPPNSSLTKVLSRSCEKFVTQVAGSNKDEVKAYDPSPTAVLTAIATVSYFLPGDNTAVSSSTINEGNPLLNIVNKHIETLSEKAPLWLAKAIATRSLNRLTIFENETMVAVKDPFLFKNRKNPYIDILAATILTPEEIKQCVKEEGRQCTKGEGRQCTKGGGRQYTKGGGRQCTKGGGRLTFEESKSQKEDLWLSTLKNHLKDWRKITTKVKRRFVQQVLSEVGTSLTDEFVREMCNVAVLCADVIMLRDLYYQLNKKPYPFSMCPIAYSYVPLELTSFEDLCNTWEPDCTTVNRLANLPAENERLHPDEFSVITSWARRFTGVTRNFTVVNLKNFVSTLSEEMKRFYSLRIESSLF